MMLMTLSFPDCLTWKPDRSLGRHIGLNHLCGMSAVTAEVARRQPDVGWFYVIDHPYAGSEPDGLATLAATEAPAT